jgi:hypothetical protein
MRSLFLSLCLILSAVSQDLGGKIVIGGKASLGGNPSSALPSLVQFADGSTNSLSGTDTITIYKLPMPQGSLSGNLLAVFVTWGSTSTSVAL